MSGIWLSLVFIYYFYQAMVATFESLGRSIQAEGITPDLVAEQPREDGAPSPIREEELPGHLQAKHGGSRPMETRRAPEARGAPPTRFKDDPQGAQGYWVLREMMN